jgi:hypothetical protein
MKNMIRSCLLSLVLASASIAFGKVPALNVIVSDAGGKAAFKGTTNAEGVFATASLKPGSYTVQFNSDSAAVKGNNYSIVVSAGKKKVSAGPVPGEKFAHGGVAIKVDVAAGLNITGQVITAMSGPVKDGKKMVWIPPQLGSHQPGHWAEEGSPEAVEAKASNLRSADGVDMRDKH